MESELTLVSSPIEARSVKSGGASSSRSATAPSLPDAPLPLCIAIREGRRVIGPRLAERALKEAHYEGQRKTYDHHVTLLADMMRRGKWTEGSQIAFAKVGDKLFLVNGRHRLHAVLASQRDIEFQVLVIDAADMAEVARLYYHFDVATRARGVADILNAVDAAGSAGSSKGMAKSVYAAAAILSNGLRIPHYQSDPVKARSVDQRLDAAKAWWAIGAAYEKLIDEADGSIRRKLYRPGTVAVALATMKWQPEKAATFWRGIAQNDGLRRGDPRHTLIADFNNRVVSSGAHSQTIIVPCVAWNAWFDVKSLSIIKCHEATVPKLLGTPFDGRRR